MKWQLSDRILDLAHRAVVLGIVNATPDSFSDGGQHAATEAAVAHGLQLIEQGADILDIGGESTRPGAEPVSVEEELRRVVPVVAGLRAQSDVLISVDTSKAAVARECLAAGAQIINDVTGLAGDADMPAAAHAAGAGLIVMHMQGRPATMQLNPQYLDVVKEIGHFFEARLQALAEVGIARERVALDPGIGFGKSRGHNLEILGRMDEFQSLGRPVCLGVSRKGLLGKVLDRPVEQRLAGSLAAASFALAHGTAQILRVHDVAETCDAVRLIAAIRQNRR